MGLSFDINAASWISYLIRPNAEIPVLDTPSDEKGFLVGNVLPKLSKNFLSSPQGKKNFERIIKETMKTLNKDPHIRITNRDLANCTRASIKSSLDSSHYSIIGKR